MAATGSLLHKMLGHSWGVFLETVPLDDDHNKGLRTPPFLLMLPLETPAGLLEYTLTYT